MPCGDEGKNVSCISLHVRDTEEAEKESGEEEGKRMRMRKVKRADSIFPVTSAQIHSMRETASKNSICRPKTTKTIFIA